MSAVELETLNRLNNLSVYDMATHAATGFCKPSIILFDTRPGTRSFTIPQGVTRIRAFVVGAGGESSGGNSTSSGGGGGGYSEKEYLVTGGDSFDYTVGTAPGGTSSFNAEITATGGGNDGGAGGIGSGGDINTSGGNSSGHRYGDGAAGYAAGGSGWGQAGSGTIAGGSGGIDGFGLGITPSPSTLSATSTIKAALPFLYGAGAPGEQSAWIGGSGGYKGAGGVGGGAGGGDTRGMGGPGLVGIEVLEVE